MGWVKDALAELNQGRNAHVRPMGGSMRGRIESGQLVTISPTTVEDVAVDDIIFVKWKGSHILHLVKEIKDNEFLIGNTVGKINGWVDGSAIVGKVTAIDPVDSDCD